MKLVLLFQQIIININELVKNSVYFTLVARWGYG